MYESLLIIGGVYMFEITSNIIDNHIDNILKLSSSLLRTSASVLVGPNSSGKSYVSKQLGCELYLQQGYLASCRICKEVLFASQIESRDIPKELSANKDWSTGLRTIHIIDDIVDSMDKLFLKDNKQFFLIIDGPEIGMSIESQMAMGQYIINLMHRLMKHHLGILIITNSDIILDQLIAAKFNFNYLGYNELHNSYEEYIHRKTLPADFSWMDKWSNMLSIGIERRSVPMVY